MPFSNMQQELLGMISGSNLGLVKIKINEAFEAIQNENVWSFQCITGGWLTANMLGGPNAEFLSPGTITVVPFQNTIIGDSIATAAWNAPVPYPPLLTQQQIRVPYYSPYSIIALGTDGTLSYVTISDPGSSQTPGTYVLDGDGDGDGAQISVVVNADGTVTLPPMIVNNGANYTTVTFVLAAGGVPATFLATLTAQLTIDRPWIDPPISRGQYFIYQCYYPAPPGFKRWFYISDTISNGMMDFWSKTAIDLARDDPQRTIFAQPYYVVPFEMDVNPGSATYGSQLFELWPQPIAQLSYRFGCQANWPKLVKPSDTIPYPLTEELVKLRALEMLSMVKEGWKGDEMERGTGANWQFLAQAYREEYQDRLKRIRIMDRHLKELYFTKALMNYSSDGEPFASTNMQVNVGTF